MNQLRFSTEELNDLIKAWLVISLAFTLAQRGLMGNLFMHFAIASLTVGMAFIVHELAHKFVAQRYGCWAEFRAFDLGLLLALMMSLTGFIFVAPGAVMIAGVVTQAENGKIAAAGTSANLVLAAVSLFLLLLIPSSLLSSLLAYNFRVNSWLALFNLIPFGPLDGGKVLNWDRVTWGALVSVAVFFNFFISF